MILKEAVGKVLEGWTLPNDVRKILEEAYFAQPEQETTTDSEMFKIRSAYRKGFEHGMEQSPQRKPLSFEQVEDCFPEGAIFAEDDGWLRVSAQTLHDFARAIEAAHGIKE